MVDTAGQYDKLEPDEITRTAERLSARVHARFPDRGLDKVATEVVDVVRKAADDADEIARPRWGLRFAIGLLIFVMIATFVIGVTLAFSNAGSDVDQLTSFDWLGVADSAINDLIFGGIALFFLLSLERRRKRGVALAVLHRLRSMAHVIDMHQLTKDPERLASGVVPTAQSPTLDLTPEELGRYLDYCSEMLSLVSKVAAVYAEATNDAQVLATVNEIESLVAGLSRKIWQKITLLHATQSRSDARGGDAHTRPSHGSMTE
jgi:hypothetical protein